jgi:hypothetical protein
VSGQLDVIQELSPDLKRRFLVMNYRTAEQCLSDNEFARYELVWFYSTYRFCRSFHLHPTQLAEHQIQQCRADLLATGFLWISKMLRND